MSLLLCSLPIRSNPIFLSVGWLLNTFLLPTILDVNPPYLSWIVFAGDLRSNRVLGADAGTIISVIASEAWRSAFAQYLLETFGQIACSAQTPARSSPSSRAKRGDLPLRNICWRPSVKLRARRRRRHDHLRHRERSVAICLLLSICWRPSVKSRARRRRRHDHLDHRECSVAICLCAIIAGDLRSVHVRSPETGANRDVSNSLHSCDTQECPWCSHI